MERYDSFLDAYLAFTADQESPADFHLWVGLTILSIIAARRLSLKFDYFTVYPNLYTLLLAPPAMAGKNTAMDLGIGLLNALPSDVRPIVFSGKLTSEKLFKRLAVPETGEKDSPPLLVYAPEFTVLLSKQTYTETLADLLMDLYDCPKVKQYDTIGHGLITIRNSYLVLLAGTTPEKLIKGLPDTVTQDGFLSRTTIPYCMTSDRPDNPFAEMSEQARSAQGEALTLLTECARFDVPLYLTEDAKRYYRSWYAENRRALIDDPSNAGITSRKRIHVLRTAMLLGLSRRQAALDEAILDAARLAQDALGNHLSRALSGLGGDSITTHQDHVEGLLRKHHVLQHSELLRRIHPCRAPEFHIIVATLIERGQVGRDPKRSSVYHWLETCTIDCPTFKKGQA